jgi:hypothetical protein
MAFMWERDSSPARAKRAQVPLGHCQKYFLLKKQGNNVFQWNVGNLLHRARRLLFCLLHAAAGDIFHFA